MSELKLFVVWLEAQGTSVQEKEEIMYMIEVEWEVEEVGVGVRRVGWDWGSI